MSNPYASPMTQPQYGMPPQNGTPPQNDKPVAITVFGILNLVFGTLGVCGIGANIFFFLALANNPGFQQPPNPILDHPIGYAWTMGGLVVGSFTTFMIIAGGILLLMNKDLGRVLTVCYGWISIVFGIIGMVVLSIIFFGVLGQGNVDGPEEMAAVFGMVGGSCGSLLGLVYPVLAIYFLTRENVKEYLKRVQ